MKKRILGVVCALALTLSGFGCSGGESSAGGDSAAVTRENSVVLLNGYEDQGDLGTLMIYENLGKVELNEDKAYVKNGEKSGKISVLQDLYNGRNKTVKPYLFQSTRNVSKGVIENDFKMTVGVGFSIYNANDEAKTVGVRLVYTRNYHLQSSLEAMQEYVLAPNAWTEVYLTVVREKIQLRTPRYGDNTEINLVCGFDMVFSTPDKNTKDDIFYIDDARLYKTIEAVVVDPEKTEKSNVLCSFDSEWQVNQIDYSNHTSYFTGVEWSKAFSTDGGASLKILTGGNQDTYMQLAKSRFFSHVELGDFADDDRLVMDFYSPAENGYSGTVTLWLISTSNGIFYAKTYVMSPGSVTTIDVPISEINSEVGEGKYKADVANAQCFEYLNKIQISVKPTSSANILYLDNIRIEKAGD